MAKTPAQARAQAKYDGNNYDRVGLLIRKDSEINRDYIRFFADSKGMSLNKFIIRAIEEKIARDKDL